MIIVRLWGGTGNQLFQYATGLRLALKWNTELKIDKINLDNDDNSFTFYTLDNFNITATPATPEEIAPLKEICFRTGLGMQKGVPLKTILDYPDNIYLHGDWCNEEYFPGIRDILLKQLTLKNPLSPIGEAWKRKIMSAECSVSMHFRHGDFLYNPNAKTKPWFHVPPMDYYYKCMDTLKHRYGTSPTAFIFSNNMPWVKENLHLDVPTEFVEGWQDKERFNGFFMRDIEEMYLMSLCNHNINPRSAFSWWASYLNQNPDKKIFISISSTAEEVRKYQYSLTTNDTSPLESGKWLYVPFDPNNQPGVTMRPIFSLLLVVNNDAATISDTLNSILNQDYDYYEVIIIDNASTDGSDKICQDAIKDNTKVTYKRLRKKVSNVAAWNRAFKTAQGKYVLFLKVGDRFLNNSLTSLYLINESRQADITHMFSWLEENEGGNVAFAGKKFSAQLDDEFQQEKRGIIMSKDGLDAARLLLNRQINFFLGTKLYNVEFLTENKIKFNEQLTDETAELAFQAEAFLKTKYFMYLANAFYIVPLQKSRRYSTARIDIRRMTTQGDFQIISVSDTNAPFWKPAWFQNSGIGYQIHSYAGKLDIVAKSTVDGRVNLWLRGLDVRTPEDYSKRIPYWIDYTKLVVNDNVIFDKVTPAWHDKPYNYNMEIKADDEIRIQIEWLAHK